MSDTKVICFKAKNVLSDTSQVGLPVVDNSEEITFYAEMTEERMEELLTSLKLALRYGFDKEDKL